VELKENHETEDAIHHSKDSATSKSNDGNMNRPSVTSDLIHKAQNNINAKFADALKITNEYFSFQNRFKEYLNDIVKTELDKKSYD